ncbi:MAG: hypothetical protein RIR70_778, partial [Pseudomonadota bacterium]
ELADLQARHHAARGALRERAWVRGVRDSIQPIIASGSRVALIDAVAASLPQDAFLEELQLDAGQIRLIGRAKDPALLTAQLTSGGMLQEVRLVNRQAGQAGEADRFEILAKPKGAP